MFIIIDKYINLQHQVILNHNWKVELVKEPFVISFISRKECKKLDKMDDNKILNEYEQK